jgi:beta-glucanase (GH16 family)
VSRCRLIAFFCAVVCAGIMAAPARSTSRPRLAPTAHALGRGTLDPANVTAVDGRLALGLPAGRTDGAEVRSAAAYRRGRFAARIKVADAPSSITGFFLYAPPDFASEIDIEILNDRSGTILLTTYADGRETHHERRKLGFDPTAATHEYRIDWSRGAAGFAVDGRVLRRWTGAGIPTAPMNLYLNAWFPRWLDGTAPPVPAFTTVAGVTRR